MKYFLLALFAFFAYTVAVYAAEPLAITPDGQQALFQLSYSDADAAIGAALSQKGAGSMVAATINGQKTTPLFSYTKPVSVEIHGLQFDKNVGRWTANLIVMSDTNVVSAMPLAGQFQEMAEVPVLRREIHNGDIIKAVDIEVRDFPMAHTRSDTITDISDLIGKSPAHVISPNRPVRSLEVISPAVVKKNGTVKIRYVMPGMEITTTGQAMADGSKGETIDVRNTSSKKIVQAVVRDENTVNIVTTGGQYAAN